MERLANPGTLRCAAALLVAAFGTSAALAAPAEAVAAAPLAAPTAVAGLMLALVVTFAPVLRGEAPLTHVPGPGEGVVQLGTLELVTAVAFDVGVFLLVLGAVVGVVRTIALAGDRGAS